MGVIYLRTNKVNGKQYVGQTKDFDKRERHWKCLKLRYANQLLTEERELYGLSNFETTILKRCDDSELDRWEVYFIERYNTIYPKGYNSTKGGAINFKHSEETKKKISEANKGQCNGMFGKTPWNYGVKMNEELKEKLSISHIGNTSALGHKVSEESRKKISETKKGKTNTKLTKRVYQYTLDGVLVKVWDSVKECKENGFNHTDAVARGERKQDKGFIWSYKPIEKDLEGIATT